MGKEFIESIGIFFITAIVCYFIIKYFHLLNEYDDEEYNGDEVEVRTKQIGTDYGAKRYRTNPFDEGKVFNIVERSRCNIEKPKSGAPIPDISNFTIVVGKPPSASVSSNEPNISDNNISKKRPFKVFEDKRKYTVWEDPLLKLGNKNFSLVDINMKRTMKIFSSEELNEILNQDPHITMYAIELVYKWFRLQGDGKLNFLNPIHIGALAIAREIVINNDNFMSVEIPCNLQELSDMIMKSARSYLRINEYDDVDYRIIEHFIAVSIATREVLKLQK